ncbi:MAG: metallophosphoesterase, partial [Lachnospiraceae bacterium]|nr:metallophosphoesterase [Lachnospiraceae bacterium]
PVDYKNLKSNGADLALSGHTHAGQIFPATLFTPFFNENNYGFKVVDDLQTVVTSGVGYYGPPLRVGCDSEIMVLNIHFK